jgi:hypothetical protein
MMFITTSIFSQSCSKFYPFSKGANMQITTYGNNNRIAAIGEYTVKNISTISNTETAIMTSVMKDKKGNILTESNYELNCNGDSVSIDFKSMMSPQIVSQFKDMKTEITGTNLVIPNNLSVGQTLPNASIELKINMSGINMDMATHIKNREVIGKETITTPAGIFDCYVISYNIDLNTNMGMSQSNSAKQWIAEGVGMVKQEDYNKKGEITSSSLLTSFNN